MTELPHVDSFDPEDKDAFDSWVHSDEFKKAHGRSDGSELLRGHPQMGTYEVAVKREPESPGV